MSKKNLILSTIVFLILAWPLACKREEAKPGPETDMKWYRYISAHTGGTIFRASPVKILFVGNPGTRGPAAAGLFEFSPAIEGRSEWTSPRELVFVPSRGLEPGRHYRAVLNIGRILDLPKALSRFEFAFDVVKPDMEVTVEGLKAEDFDRPEILMLKGNIHTADREEPVLVEKVLAADQEGKKLAIEWSHSAAGFDHQFTIRGVERREEASRIRLAWDGSPLRIDNRGTKDVDISALSDFELISSKALNEPVPSILLQFSDPLARDQNLKGLIRAGDRPLTFEIEGYDIRIYSTSELSGTVDVDIFPGIRNHANRKLKTEEHIKVVFESMKPQVRFVGRGVILPDREKLTVPFEAVGLKAVQITAMQIYDNNIAQFFQLNNFEGSEELVRVGRFLWRKTLNLTEDEKETKTWKRYNIDVTSLFRENPGNFFRLILSSNRGNSTYACEPSQEPVVVEPPLKNVDDANQVHEYSSWDNFEQGYVWNYTYWARRNDPCSDAYYNPRYNDKAVVGRNFLASNVGLTAKFEERGILRVVATDIATAQPLTDMRVRTYNYQNQLLGEAMTDGNGFAVFELEDRPFYIIAEGRGDKGYLRISRSDSLSMSHFDVGGETVKKGIKGAIYGERGVWRPGDVIHLTFVLFDSDKVLPPAHPVILEFYNPSGQLVQTHKPEKVVEPFYAFRLQTGETAPTGNWRARVLAGGLEFSKSLRIETVVPNRLKIELKTGREVLTSGEMPLEVPIAAQWLHGAPASGLKFDVTVRLSPRPTVFRAYADYKFDDPARVFSGGTIEVGRGLLDERGNGLLKIDIKPPQPSPGMLDAAFVTRVFEESGNFSIDSFSLAYHPYVHYVGVKLPIGDAARGMLLTDRDQEIQIVTVDSSGQPVSKDGIIVSLYKIDWKWWWDKSADASLAEYISNVQTRPLEKGVISTKGGLGTWKFRVNYPAWGRYLIRAEDPEGGHASGQIVYIDWPGWAGRARTEAGTGASRLDFSADKEKYRIGEKAVIFLPEAVDGRALVSIEKGSSIIDMKWISTVKGENRFEIPLTPAMTPNVYVHVSLIQPHRNKVSDTPIRMYGVIPIFVEDPATRLEPQIKTADELRPREKFKVEISEKNGRPMVYTLAVVEEGLLNLTRFATPDLWRSFYAREALGVRTWDLFDHIAEAYGAELARILSLGGDEAGQELEKASQPRRFPPVVLFEGPFELAAGKRDVRELEMPQYFGAVRVMVVAGKDAAFGSAGKSVPVRRDLLILATLPRVIRPGEEMAMPVSVFVTNPALKEVAVSVETNEMFDTVGEREKKISFDLPGDRIVSFALKAADRTGSGQVRFKAVSGPEKVEDAVFIPVLPSNPAVTRTESLTVDPGKMVTRQVTPFGLEGTNSVILEASFIPNPNLEKRLDFLISYPHGCLEQTVSAAFPQLYLKNLVRLDEKQARAVDRNVKAALDKTADFQMPNGAFSYWPGYHRAHEWTTSYTGYFLLEAARAGYHVPQTMLESWKASQKMMVNRWVAGGKLSTEIQAFRLLTLALAGDPDLGAMNRLRETEGLDGLGALELAAAFHLAGQPEAAADLARRASFEFKPYRDQALTFGSASRDQALAARLLVMMGRRAEAFELVKKVSKALASDEWFSTQETAFGLMAVAAYYSGEGLEPLRFSYSWDSQPASEVKMSALFERREFTGFGMAGRTLKIVNKDRLPVYVNIYTRGIPAAGEEIKSAQGLSLEVKYLGMNMVPISIDRIQQGSDIVAWVKVKNLTGRRLENLILSHLTAAAFQIRNPRLTEEGRPAVELDYQDVRDDRVFTYFQLEIGEEKIFRVVLNASFRGRFYQPGIAVEAMYDSSVHANSAGSWLEIFQ